LNAITWIHIAGGMVALASGGVAAAVGKGSSLHAKAGIGFCVAMLVLGVTASILSPFKTPPESPVGGIMVCYFVATAWMTARRHSGRPGKFEKIACAVVLTIALAIMASGLEAAFSAAPPSGPPGPGALIALGAICLLAGLGDLKFIVRGQLSARQRITRHLWRMCFAFFIATGSFFLGQQDVLPAVVRGSPVLFVLAFAPFGLMLFWLVRVRSSRFARSTAISGTLRRTGRQAMSNAIREAFEQEWSLAGAARDAGHFDAAFHHLERAHILGQRSTGLHVRSHVGMLGIAWQRRNARELTGQLTRILAAALFSRLWVPVGNTGGANVSAMRPMAVPPDLRAILDRDHG
jgi:hypothetical protein